MIKSFEEFHGQSAVAPMAPTATSAAKINEETKEKIKVGQETPKEGEAARWGVVLKGTGAGAENGINYKGIIDQLVQSVEFKAWWNETDPARKISNFTLLALVDAAHKDAGLLRKESTKADVVFMVYLKGTQAAYDVHSATPIVDGVQVGDSPVKLTAWKMEDLPKLKLYSRDYNDSWNRHTKGTPIIEFGLNLDIVNNLGTDQSKYTPYSIYHNLIGYYKGQSNGTSGNAGKSVTPTPVAQTTGTAGLVGTPAGTSGNQPTHSMTIAYQGKKMTIPPVYDRAIAELQSRMSQANPLAAAELKKVGGVDGKYAHHTAMAIGIILGTNQEVTEITPDIATQLEDKLKNIKSSAPTAGTTGPSTHSAPISPKQLVTPKKTIFKIIAESKVIDVIGNYGSYARMLELNRYTNLNESLIVEAGTAADAVAQVLSGQKGGQYVKQYNQLVDQIAAVIDAGQNSGTAIITHDDKSPMVNIPFTIDATKNVSLNKAAATVPAATATTTPTDQAPAAGQDAAVPTTQADILLDQLSQKIVEKFSDASFWKPWKNTFNDDEDGAWTNGFVSWFTQYIAPQLNQLKAAAPNPDANEQARVLRNISILEQMIQTGGELNKKFLGGTGNDDFSWTLYLSTGTKSYTVDTDF